MPRKIRSNKGKKRGPYGPRTGKTLSGRKTRSNKGKKRGPYGTRLGKTIRSIGITNEYLSEKDINLVIKVYKPLFTMSGKSDSYSMVIDDITKIKYDPKYIGVFDGIPINKNTKGSDALYYQITDKIDGWFKYGNALV